MCNYYLFTSFGVSVWLGFWPFVCDEACASLVSCSSTYLLMKHAFKYSLAIQIQFCYLLWLLKASLVVVHVSHQANPVGAILWQASNADSEN